MVQHERGKKSDSDETEDGNIIGSLPIHVAVYADDKFIVQLTTIKLRRIFAPRRNCHMADNHF